jgi:RNA 2',3'-cyclic 3'-phosphodiesterase
MAKRLFIALELPEACREILAGLGTPIRGVRWLRADQLHLTLAFLGDVEEEVEMRLLEKLDRVRVAPFVLKAKDMGTFGKPRPTVIWAGVGTGHPHLFALHKHVHDALLAAHFDPALRSFHPHITLARLKDVSVSTVRPFLKKFEEQEICVMEITAFGLFSSKLSPEGSSYTMEDRYELRRS